MCGIAGIISLDGHPVDPLSIFKMNRLVMHRGPDSGGYLWLKKNGIGWSAKEGKREDEWTSLGPDGLTAAFGHRRLSILDLSEAGRQPMASQDGQQWIVHNGEVYNYIELRRELEAKGYRFHSNTDTEVILGSYREWGKDCLSRFNGMWAFAILDLAQGGVFCARDRVGVKPFYYYYDGKRFLFASEIKQFFATSSVPVCPDYGVLYDYLIHGIVDHSEVTFYACIKQLRGGHYLWIPLQPDISWMPEPARYWDIDLGKKNPGWTDAQYVERFLELFEDSIRLRLRSDVTVGSCLSGGLDSSGVVCVVNRLLKAKGGKARQKTFSSCFEDKRYDERCYIEEITNFTGVDSYYVFPGGEKLFDELDKLMWHQDEPFVSTSIYAQWNVFRLARENGVTVMLDGQGADEILAGYLGYRGAFLANLLVKGHLNGFLREIRAYRRLYGHSMAETGRSMASALLDGWAKLFILKRSGERIGWLNPEFIEEGEKLSPYYSYLATKKDSQRANRGTPFDRKLYEMILYTNLPALLRYEDRNSMAFSIESRVPFLDYRLIEFMFATSDDQKIRNGYTKHIYREAMRSILPEAVRLRLDKMGFVTPEEVWVKSILRSFLEEIFKGLSANDEVFDRKGLEESFSEVVNGHRPFDFAVWRWVSAIKWKEGIK